ncbi:MAG: alpha/beta fold hydrolase [Actinobacteria bacterium]|nr:alpha/beta fold hydrolase [Actinomycetota bacterium]
METVRFQTSDDVLLEGELRVDGPAWGSAVVCHPHPQHGGSKDHPLLWAVRNALAQRGLAVLTFNFRGVMGSEGSFGGGVHEVRDVRAAITRVREAAEGPTFLAGWSFGASIALREALDDDRVGALALLGFVLEPQARVALPDPPSAEELGGLGRPALFVSGDSDRFCPADDLRELASWVPGAEVVIVEGADHFFWRHEREAGALVADFAERTLRS